MFTNSNICNYGIKKDNKSSNAKINLFQIKIIFK